MGDEEQHRSSLVGWFLYRVDQYEDDPDRLADMVEHAPVRLGRVIQDLVSRRLIDATTGSDGRLRRARLTGQGRDVVARLTEARRQGLSDLLGGPTVDHHPELADRLRTLAHELMADDATLLREATPAAAR